jgi:predicted DCC family thiol-disulfide oxidoreductase YuxK
MNRSQLILIYDGYCNLCTGLVAFIVKTFPAGAITLVDQHSAYGHQLTSLLRSSMGYQPDSIVAKSGDAFFIKSEAVLQLCRAQGLLGRGIYRLGKMLPLRWRDGLYDRIAANRYSWFGTTNACPLPSKNL